MIPEILCKNFNKSAYTAFPYHNTLFPLQNVPRITLPRNTERKQTSPQNYFANYSECFITCGVLWDGEYGTF